LSVHAAEVKKFHKENKLPVQGALSNKSDLQTFRKGMSNTMLLGNRGGKKPKDRLKDRQTDACKVPLLLADLLPSIILLAFHTALARQ